MVGTPLTQRNNINNINLRHIHCIITNNLTIITIINTRTKTSYINYIQLKRELVLVLRTNLRASRLSMFQLQAEHRHAAGLIDLLFKGRVICLICYKK